MSRQHPMFATKGKRKFYDSQMIVSKKSLATLRTQLPKDWATKLEKKLPIGAIMIRAIMRGDYTDRHGVIEEALKLRDRHQAKQNIILKRIHNK